MTPMSRPVSCFTRARNSRPLTARRQASVAIARSRRTGRRASRAAQACRAARARSMAVGLSAPVRCRPSPSRTMREKLSSTRKLSPDGAPTSMRQLLVPRSSAAKAGPGSRCVCVVRMAAESAEGASCGIIAALSYARGCRGKLRMQLPTRPCREFTPGKGGPTTRTHRCGVSIRVLGRRAGRQSAIRRFGVRSRLFRDKPA